MLPLLLLITAPAWQPWSDDVFARAAAEHRLVLLDLGAGWCHWCHVMDEVTYEDPTVVRIIGDRFIAVRADADRMPDLAQRYEDYGWPATIVFAADGTELVKLRGYLPPKRMASMLQAVAEDPTPGPSAIREGAPVTAVTTHRLADAQRASILERYFAVYDRPHGGWGTVHHYAHPESVEHALLGALRGDAALERMAKQTLDANLRLIDPKSGGVWQYSDAGKPNDPWGSPHFEKIMQFQASNLRLYSLAYAIFGDAAYQRAATAIYRYLIGTLRCADGGAFYTSQDADSGRIDRHRFARENDWAIAALAAYAGTFGDDEALAHARRAADWVIAHRRRPDATFAHGKNDARPHLGDDVAMVEAFLLLAEVSAHDAPRWLSLAEETLAALDRVYRVESGGYQTSTIDPRARGALRAPYLQIEENIAVARAAVRLSHPTIAEHAMRFLTSPSVTSRRRFLIGVVLADGELGLPPAELTIIGAKDEPHARALHRAVLALPAPYRRVSWIDPDHQTSASKYPRRPAPAAYLCVAGACSRPVQDAGQLRSAYRALIGLTGER